MHWGIDTRWLTASTVQWCRRCRWACSVLINQQVASLWAASWPFTEIRSLNVLSSILTNKQCRIGVYLCVFFFVGPYLLHQNLFIHCTWTRSNLTRSFKHTYGRTRVPQLPWMFKPSWHWVMAATNCNSLSCSCRNCNVVCQQSRMPRHLLMVKSVVQRRRGKDGEGVYICGTTIRMGLRFQKGKVDREISQTPGMKNRVSLFLSVHSWKILILAFYKMDCFIQDMRRKEKGEVGYRRMVGEESARSRRLVGVMKSPGTSSAAPIIMCEQLTPNMTLPLCFSSHSFSLFPFEQVRVSSQFWIKFPCDN